MRIHTIGHSTRTLAELVTLLEEHGITRLADVRRYPASRRHPHFSKASLERSLPVEYVHFEDLGGHRTPSYSDYMLTAAFGAAVDRLLASSKATAVMCAEALPENCHRNLLSEALVRRGVEVIHILGPAKVARHGDTGQKSLDFRAL